MDVPVITPLKHGPESKILDPDVIARLLTAIRKGAAYKIACGYAGVSYQSFRTWIIRAESVLHLDEDKVHVFDMPYLDFYQKLKQVEGLAALKWLEKIDKAAETQWQAAAWKLERRYPELYGRYEKENKEDADNTLDKAKADVERLKGDDHGRSSST